MQIDDRDPAGGSRVASCYMLALEPPGNVARDLAAYRRALFSRMGEPSGLFLPEAAPLAFARRLPRDAVSAKNAHRVLGSVFLGVDGGFRATSPIERRGSLYLELDGPVEHLALRSRDALTELALEPLSDPPVEPGAGFFLCRAPLAAPRHNQLPAIPSISFLDCSLVLLRLRFGPSPYASATWRVLVRVKRRTGALSARIR